MASFFNSIGSGLNSAINWVGNTGVGHFATGILQSGGNFISGIANIPNDLNNLVGTIANNSQLFFWAIIIIGGAVIINELKGGSSPSPNYSSNYYRR